MASQMQTPSPGALLAEIAALREAGLTGEGK
jgi:hypothetical protein